MFLWCVTVISSNKKAIILASILLLTTTVLGQGADDDDFHNFEPIEGMDERPDYDEKFVFEEGDVFRLVRGSDDRFLENEVFLYESLGVLEGKLKVKEYSVGGGIYDPYIEDSGEEWYERIKSDSNYCEESSSNIPSDDKPYGMVDCDILEVPVHEFRSLGEHNHEIFHCDDRNSEILIRGDDREAHYESAKWSLARDECAIDPGEIDNLSINERGIFEYSEGEDIELELQTDSATVDLSINDIQEKTNRGSKTTGVIDNRRYNLEDGVIVDNLLIHSQDKFPNPITGQPTDFPYIIVEKRENYQRNEVTLGSTFSNEHRTEFEPGHKQIVADEEAYNVKWGDAEANLRSQDKVEVEDKEIDYCSSGREYVELNNHYIVLVDNDCDGLTHEATLKAVSTDYDEERLVHPEATIEFDKERYETGDEVGLEFQTEEEGPFIINIEGPSIDRTEEVEGESSRTFSFEPSEVGEFNAEVLAENGEWPLLDSRETLDQSSSGVYDVIPEASVEVDGDAVPNGEAYVEYSIYEPGEYLIIAELNGEEIISEELDQDAEDTISRDLTTRDEGEFEASVIAPGSSWNPFNNDEVLASNSLTVREAKEDQVGYGEKINLSINSDPEEIAVPEDGNRFIVENTYRTRSTYERNPLDRTGVVINIISRDHNTFRLRPEEYGRFYSQRTPSEYGLMLCSFEKITEGNYAEIAVGEKNENSISTMENRLRAICNADDTESSTEECSYSLTGRLNDGDERIDTSINITNDGEVLESSRIVDSEYEAEFTEECESNVDLELVYEDDNISREISLPTESSSIERDIYLEHTSSDNSFGLMPNPPYTLGDEIVITPDVTDEVAEEGYQIDVEGPESFTENYPNPDSNFTFRPETPGDYKITMRPSEGFLNSILAGLAGSEIFHEKEITVAQDTNSWEGYCGNLGYTNSISGKVTCIEDEIVPSCFEGEVRDECDEVGQSLCNDLLGMNFYPDQKICQ